MNVTSLISTEQARACEFDQAFYILGSAVLASAVTVAVYLCFNQIQKAFCSTTRREGARFTAVPINPPSGRDNEISNRSPLSMVAGGVVYLFGCLITIVTVNPCRQ